MQSAFRRDHSSLNGVWVIAFSLGHHTLVSHWAPRHPSALKSEVLALNMAGIGEPAGSSVAHERPHAIRRTGNCHGTTCLRAREGHLATDWDSSRHLPTSSLSNARAASCGSRVATPTCELGAQGAADHCAASSGDVTEERHYGKGGVARFVAASVIAMNRTHRLLQSQSLWPHSHARATPRWPSTGRDTPRPLGRSVLSVLAHDARLKARPCAAEGTGGGAGSRAFSSDRSQSRRW